MVIGTALSHAHVASTDPPNVSTAVISAPLVAKDLLTNPFVPVASAAMRPATGTTAINDMRRA